MPRLPVKRALVKLMFVALMLMCVTDAMCAQLTIRVKEKGSGMPLEAATVVLEGTDAYALSDAQGTAQLQWAGDARVIRVLASGYETRERTLRPDDQIISIYLIPVLVSGEGLEAVAERLDDTVAKISVSREELLNSAGTQGDPLKALTALPGVVGAGESSSQVYMRGSDSGDNIVWVNRAPVGYLYHLGGFQSTINPLLMEDINLFPAGFPVEYGDALGGVIDVKLRAPRRDRVRSHIDVSTIMTSAAVEGPVGKAKKDSFFVAGRRSYVDLILSPEQFNNAFEDEEEDDPDQITLVPRFYDAQALYHQVLRNGYVDYYLFAAGDELAQDIRGSAASDPQLAGEARNKQSFQTLGATWWQRWGGGWDQVTALGYYHHEEELAFGQDELGDAFFSNVKSHTLFAQPELRWSGARAGKVFMGLEVSHLNIPLDANIPRPPDETDPDYDFTSKTKYRLDQTVKVNSLSPYVKYRKPWGERWVTSLGLRYNTVSITGGFESREWSPRLSAQYSLTRNTLLSAAWGRYVQVPRGVEPVEGIGNPYLTVEQAEHRVLGLQYRFHPLYSLRTEVYHKPMRDLIVSIDENAPPESFANEGRGEAYGIDFYLRREPRNRRFGWIALSLSRSERTNELTGVTRPFSGDQPVALTAVWGQPFGGGWRRWDWSVKFQAHSGEPYTEVVGRHREDPSDPDSRWIAEYGEHNDARLPFYYRADVRIARTFLFNESRMKLYLDLQNVTNSRNIIEYDYGNEFERIGNPREVTGTGFFPYLGVEMTF